MPNLKIPHIMRQAFSLLPAFLLLFRWFFFWLLETSLFQFYNDKSGRRAREWAVKTSRDYVRKTAPEQYWPLLTPSYDLGCRVSCLVVLERCFDADTITLIAPHLGRQIPQDSVQPQDVPHQRLDCIRRQGHRDDRLWEGIPRRRDRESLHLLLPMSTSF